MPDIDDRLITLIRILARLAPPVAFLLAAAFAVVSVAVGILGSGDYVGADARRLVAGLFVLFALVSAAIGIAIPLIAKRFLPPRD